MKADDYRRHAASCILMAEEATGAGERARLMAMAAAWARLAEQAERNARTDVVYETPDE